MSLLPLFYHDFFDSHSHPLSLSDNYWTLSRPVSNKSQSQSQSQSQSLTSNMNSILKVDLLETETDFQVHADLPGVDEKDLDISIENNHLVIKGHREKKYEVKTATEHRVERSYGSIQRSIRLPPNADQSSCNANFENGVLTISLTKVTPRPIVNKIQIKSTGPGIGAGAGSSNSTSNDPAPVDSTTSLSQNEQSSEAK